MFYLSPSMRRYGGLRVKQLRRQAGLSRAALAALSGVAVDFIGALENCSLCQLISDQEIQHALARFNGDGPQRLMRRTLTRWATDLHRVADALAEMFENLFPADWLSSLSDQLWVKIEIARTQQAAPDQSAVVSLANPWHDWGWFRNVALSDDLVDDTANDPLEACGLQPAMSDLVGKLQPREQLVLAWRYGFDGPPCTLAEIAHRLGVTSEAVRRIEQHALSYLRHPYRSRRLRDYLN